MGLIDEAWSTTSFPYLRPSTLTTAAGISVSSLVSMAASNLTGLTPAIYRSSKHARCKFQRRSNIGREGKRGVAQFPLDLTNRAADWLHVLPQTAS